MLKMKDLLSKYFFFNPFFKKIFKAKGRKKISKRKENV